MVKHQEDKTTKQSRFWIDNDQALSDCCHQLASCKVIAVDTEFMRTDTFYPIAALFQLSDGERCYLIDPLVIENFQPLIDLFKKPSIIKVFHACSEDLEVCETFLNCVPSPIVDTQIAAGLAGYESSLGYAALVKTLLEIELEKGETRSNWLKRPLDEKQHDYAADDVEHLLAVYQLLQVKLDNLQRLQWLDEECHRLIDSVVHPVPVSEFYRRIKSAWKLSRKDLGILKALSDWREIKAREKNLPRNHVLREKVIYELAVKKPKQLHELKSISEFHPKAIRQYGETVLEIIEKSNLDETQWPDRLPAPLSSPQKKLLKLLKATVEEAAEEHQLPMDVLAKKADYEYIVRSGMNGKTFQLPARMQGWRSTIVGNKLLAVANDYDFNSQS